MLSGNWGYHQPWASLPTLLGLPGSCLPRPTLELLSCQPVNPSPSEVMTGPGSNSLQPSQGPVYTYDGCLSILSMPLDLLTGLSLQTGLCESVWTDLNFTLFDEYFFYTCWVKGHGGVIIETKISLIYLFSAVISEIIQKVIKIICKTCASL